MFSRFSLFGSDSTRKSTKRTSQRRERDRRQRRRRLMEALEDRRPTRTIYTFEGAGVALTLTFTTATLPEDLDILAPPVTYVT